MEPILQVENLKTSFFTSNGEVQAVRGVSFSVEKGDILGIVGESGSGKSVTSMSILKLLADTGKIKEGTIFFEGQELTKMGKAQMRKIRGEKIAMIFQDPMSSLNPLIPVGKQVAEMIKEHHPEKKKDELKREVLDLFARVRIPEPEKRYNSYPHEFSGGMRQRVVIAIALAANPKLIIADEPTTALDVTIQAQILKLMKKLVQERQASLILITHDLAVVSEMVDRVIVMYCGKIVEQGPVDKIINEPSHPYTIGLLDSIPRLRKEQDRLDFIPGMVPNMYDLPSGCLFAPRCKGCKDVCRNREPEMKTVGSNHSAACHFPRIDY